MVDTLEPVQSVEITHSFFIYKQQYSVTLDPPQIIRRGNYRRNRLLMSDGGTSTPFL